MLGQCGELEELGDAADARGVRLDDVAGVVPYELVVLGDAGQHLARGDRGVQGGGERGVALGVVGVERLLDPDEAEALQGAAHALGGGPVPLLVGVDHERDVVAEVLTHGRQAGQVLLAVGVADLDLGPDMTGGCSGGH